MSQFGSRFTCPVGRHMPSCRALTAYHSSKLSNLSPSKSTPRKGEATLAQSAPGAFTEGIRRLSLRHAVGHAVRHAVWHSATICNQCYTLTPYVLHRFAVYQYNVVLGSMQQTIFTSCNLQNKKKQWNHCSRLKVCRWVIAKGCRVWYAEFAWKWSCELSFLKSKRWDGNRSMKMQSSWHVRTIVEYTYTYTYNNHNNDDDNNNK